MLYLGEFLGDVGDVPGVAGLAAVRDGRHVGRIRFEEHLAGRHEGCGVADVLRVLEGDDSGEADIDFGVELQKVRRELGSARKAVDVNLVVAEVGVAEYGEGVAVGFAEVQHQGLAALEPEPQVTLKKGDLARGGLRLVVVVESEFTAGDTLGV